jgi:hypothetical protein
VGAQLRQVRSTMPFLSGFSPACKVARSGPPLDIYEHR